MSYNLLVPILEINEVKNNEQIFTYESIRHMFRTYRYPVPVVFGESVNPDPEKFFHMSPLEFAGFATLTQGTGNVIFANVETAPTPKGLSLNKLIEDSVPIFFRACGVADYNLPTENNLYVRTFKLIYVTIHIGSLE